MTCGLPGCPCPAYPGSSICWSHWGVIRGGLTEERLDADALAAFFAAACGWLVGGGE